MTYQMTAHEREYRVRRADEGLEAHPDWGTWTEHGPYGSEVRCHINGAHLRKVLRAKATWRT